MMLVVSGVEMLPYCQVTTPPSLLSISPQNWSEAVCAICAQALVDSAPLPPRKLPVADMGVLAWSDLKCSTCDLKF